MLITMVTSSLALLMASAGFLVYDLVAFRTRMSHDLMTQAEIIGANSMAALAFQDERRGPRDSGRAAGQGRDRGGRHLHAGRASSSLVPAQDAARGDRARPTTRQRISLRRQPARGIPRHCAARGDARHAVHRVGHAALGRASEALHGHRRHPDVRRGAASRSCSRRGCSASSPSRFSTSNGRCARFRVRRTSPSGWTRRRTTRLGALIDGFNTMLVGDPAARRGAAGRQRGPPGPDASARAGDRRAPARAGGAEDAEYDARTAGRRAQRGGRAARQELARSQDALEKQTRILQSILDSMSDGVIVADEKGGSSSSTRPRRTSCTAS